MTLWTFVEAHITNIEMKHDALMKIAVNMHSLFGPIWQIFLPVYLPLCVPPALKKGIMFYFNFGEFGFYKGP